MSKPKSKDKLKPKESKSKPSTPSIPNINPNDPFSHLPLPSLLNQLSLLQSKLAESQRNRSYYVQERDQVNQFDEIVRSEVERMESHVRNVRSQMERMEETHRNEIKIYLQKVIHLEYEHNHTLSQLSTVQSQQTDSLTQSLHNTTITASNTRSSLHTAIEEQNHSYEEEISSLNSNSTKEFNKLKDHFEKQYQELIHYYEDKLDTLISQQMLREKMELHEIEERKNSHIQELLKNHDKNYKEMKNYYNSITADNIELIKELNSEMETIKKEQEKKELIMKNMTNKNNEISTPLKEAEKQVKLLNHQLVNYNKDKLSLNMIISHVKNKKKKLLELNNNYKEKEEEFEILIEEKIKLEKNFNELLEDLQAKSTAHLQPLVDKLKDLQDMFELKKTQFTRVLAASNINGSNLTILTEKLDILLNHKNKTIDELNYEIIKMKKSYDDLIRIMENKLRKFGIRNMKEMKERENQLLINGKTGTQPADLVVK